MNSKVNRKILKLSGWFALLFAGCALVAGILEGIVLAISAPVGFIDAGERWSASGEPYAVISLYTEDSSALSGDQIGQYAQAMESALLSASVEGSERGRVWTYACSAESIRPVTGPKSTASAAVTACGGDFFVFHPLNFIYGTSFLNDSSIPHGVVIDEDLAWKIFGAIDVVGMDLTMNGLTLTVVGITAAERNSEAYTYTYGDMPRMYMNYSAYEKINGKAADITAYEVTLPNPVKSFAMNIFKTAVTVNEDTTSLTEASARYGVMNRFENMKRLKYSFVRGDKVSYPYWENEARMIDYSCAVIMIFEVICLAAGVFSMLFSFILFRVSGFTVTDSVKNLYGKFAAERAKRPKKEKKPKVIKQKSGNRKQAGPLKSRSGKTEKTTTTVKKDGVRQ